MGLFHPFLNDERRNHRREAAGVASKPAHAASLNGGYRVYCTGNRTFLLPTTTARSLMPIDFRRPLDYPGIGPEHAWVAWISAAPSTRR